MSLSFGTFGSFRGGGSVNSGSGFGSGGGVKLLATACTARADEVLVREGLSNKAMHDACRIYGVRHIKFFGSVVDRSLAVQDPHKWRSPLPKAIYLADRLPVRVIKRTR